jgi:hypothetical protein
MFCARNAVRSVLYSKGTRVGAAMMESVPYCKLCSVAFFVEFSEGVSIFLEITLRGLFQFSVIFPSEAVRKIEKLK